MWTYPQLKKIIVPALIALATLTTITAAQVMSRVQFESSADVASLHDTRESVLELIGEERGTGSSENTALNRHQTKRKNQRAVTAGNSLSFMPVVTYESGGQYATSLAVSDLNGDGNPDVVVVNFGSGTVDVLLGNSNGTLNAAVSYGSGSYWAVSVAIADLNDDGKPDLAVTTCADNSCSNFAVGVLLGNGDGTFQPAVKYVTDGYLDQSVVVADVNADGKPDLVVANYCASASDCPTASVSVLLGNGDGSFKAASTYGSGAFYASGVAVADINGDGKMDVVVSNLCVSGSDANCANGTTGMVADGSVGVLLGNGDGTFRPAVSYDSGGKTALQVTIADVNNDGKPDLVVSNACGDSSNCGGDGLVGVLLGNGDGTFQTAMSYDSGGTNAQGVAAADVNGDGKLDLLVTNFDACSTNACPDGSVSVLLGNGDGTFQVAQSYDSGALAATSVAVTDLNKDGRPDLVVANYWGGVPFLDSYLGVLLNNTPFGKSSTSTSLISSLNPSIYGQKVAWTATVTSSGSVMPTGIVKFQRQYFTETFTIGSATLNSSGVATLTRSNLNANSYPLTAVYAGDANNLGSTSPVLNQVVLETTSTATLSSLPNPSMQGQAVTFTAKISSPTVIPTGPVTFTAGKTVLGTTQLSGGKAMLTISSLSHGSTKVTATYLGDSNIAKSSATVVQIVQ